MNTVTFNIYSGEIGYAFSDEPIVFILLFKWIYLVLKILLCIYLFAKLFWLYELYILVYSALTNIHIFI